MLTCPIGEERPWETSSKNNQAKVICKLRQNLLLRLRHSSILKTGELLYSLVPLVSLTRAGTGVWRLLTMEALNLLRVTAGLLKTDENKNRVNLAASTLYSVLC